MAHYLQSITPCLALGGELVYHRRPGEEGTVMSLAGKYTREPGGPGLWGRGWRDLGSREVGGEHGVLDAHTPLKPAYLSL